MKKLELERLQEILRKERESMKHFNEFRKNASRLALIDKRHQYMMKQVICIQTFYRGHIARKILKKARRKAKYLQRLLKGIYVRNRI